MISRREILKAFTASPIANVASLELVDSESIGLIVSVKYAANAKELEYMRRHMATFVDEIKALHGVTLPVLFSESSKIEVKQVSK